MLMKPDCIACIIRMTDAAIQKLSLPENDVKQLYEQIMAVPGLRGQSWDMTSPEVIAYVLEIISAAVGKDDPFADEKAELNRRMIDLLPFFEKTIAEAEDRVYMAAKLAILGNAIDFMIPETAENAEDFITQQLKSSLDKQAYNRFREKLSETKRILFFGDNCGEIVLDKLFIRELKAVYPLDVVFVVRGRPAMNDVTRKEALSIGLGEVAEIIENGIETRLPGTIFNQCSPQIIDLVNQADLIISKGGGNFDTLSEETNKIQKDFTFMLLSKCPPYKRLFQKELHQPVLYNTY